jgi:DDE superfamily endonuclease
LREALIVASGYMRNNITEEVWAEIFDVDQSTISRHITFLTPLIEQATDLGYSAHDRRVSRSFV